MVSPFLFNHKNNYKLKAEVNAFKQEVIPNCLLQVVAIQLVYFVLEYHSDSLLAILALEDVSGRDKLKKPVFCRYRKIPKISLSHV